jgi:hypothetical protein
MVLSLFPAVVLALPGFLGVDKQEQADCGCEITGDPHVISMFNHHCSAVGTGVFRAYGQSKRLEIQTFHCPLRGKEGMAGKGGGPAKTGATSVVATVLGDGTDTVEILGDTVYVNGKAHSGSDTTVGGITVNLLPSDKTEVHAGKVTLTAKKNMRSNMPTDYQMNVKIDSTEKVKYKNTALCSLDGSGKGLKLPCPKSQILFKDATLAALQSVCDVAFMKDFMSDMSKSDADSSTSDAESSDAESSDEEPVAAIAMSSTGYWELPCGEKP